MFRVSVIFAYTPNEIYKYVSMFFRLAEASFGVFGYLKCANVPAISSIGNGNRTTPSGTTTSGRVHLLILSGIVSKI